MTAPSIRSYMQIFSRFGLTWHRKVNFSTFSRKLTWPSKPSILSRASPGHLHFFLDLSPKYFSKIFSNKSKNENRQSKKTRAGKWSKSVKLKVNLVNYDAIWCQIGSQFAWVPMGPHGGPYGVPGKHFVIHGQIMENRSMENSWKIRCKNHGKNNGKLNGTSMENPWIIKNRKIEPPKMGSRTGIRFDTKWHHNWLN